MKAPAVPVNCNLCAHLATSWDPRLPHSCRFFGFKSRTMPSVDVLRLDGEPCQGFAAKPPPVSELRR